MQPMHAPQNGTVVGVPSRMADAKAARLAGHADILDKFLPVAAEIAFISANVVSGYARQKAWCKCVAMSGWWVWRTQPERFCGLMNFDTSGTVLLRRPVIPPPLSFGWPEPMLFSAKEGRDGMIQDEVIVSPMRSFQHRLMCVVVFGFGGSGLVGCASDASSDRAASTQWVERNRPEVAAPAARFTGQSEESPSVVQSNLVADPSTVNTSFGSAYAAPRSSAKSYLASSEPALSPREVVTWTQSGARDDVIIDRIERSDTVFRLTAGDEMQLRQQGVSDDVICAMKETARR